MLTTGQQQRQRQRQHSGHFLVNQNQRAALPDDADFATSGTGLLDQLLGLFLRGSVTRTGGVGQKAPHQILSRHRPPALPSQSAQLKQRLGVRRQSISLCEGLVGPGAVFGGQRGDALLPQQA